MTGAPLDRLTHHSILAMNGDSYRLKQSAGRRRGTAAAARNPTTADRIGRIKKTMLKILDIAKGEGRSVMAVRIVGRDRSSARTCHPVRIRIRADADLRQEPGEQTVRSTRSR